MKRDDPRHGTYAGTLAHVKESKRPCPACRQARNEYQRQHRERDKSYRSQNAARGRALWLLADLHREEFDRLYVEERTRQHYEQMKRRSA